MNFTKPRKTGRLQLMRLPARVPQSRVVSNPGKSMALAGNENC